jgi:hypothetical protein
MTVVHGGFVVNQIKHLPATEQSSREELALLLRRAEGGDQAVLPELRKLLSDHPALWEGYGDLSAQAEASLITLAAGSNLLLAESLLHKTEAMKAELAGPEASPLERLLAARVITCWLQTSYFDLQISQARDGNPARMKLLMQHLESAHRRQLSAVKMLATIRKLLAPVASPVQIATQLGSKGQGTRLRVTVPAEGVPIEN